MAPDSQYVRALWSVWRQRAPQQPLPQLGRGLLVVGLALIFPLYVAGFTVAARIPAAICFAMLLILALTTLIFWNQMLHSSATPYQQRRALLLFYGYQSLTVILLSMALLSAGLLVTVRGISAFAPAISIGAALIYVFRCIRLLQQAPEISAKALAGDDSSKARAQSIRPLFTISGVLVASTVVILDFVTGSLIPISLTLISGIVIFGAFIVLPPGLLMASQVVTLMRANPQDYD